MFKIESGIPIPPRSRGPGRKSAYPFALLEPGQSFFVKKAKSKTMSVLANQHGKRLGRRFTVRTVIESGKEGVRIWRQA